MIPAEDIVARQWQHLLEYGDDVIDPAMVRAAYAQPRLRELFPVVSHGSLYLSRRIGLPDREVGTVIRSDGRLAVLRHSDGVFLGEPETIEEAVEIIAAHLPEGCGPAIDGTPDDL